MTDLPDEPFNPFSLVERATAVVPASSTHPGDRFEVVLPSGAILPVPTEEESTYLVEMVRRYAEDYEFSNASDVGELDRCLAFELQMHRAQVQLSMGIDYQGKKVDANALMQRSKEFSAEIRQMKKGLVMDKVARDRQSGKGSVFEYVREVLEHAREFAVMRNAQQARAIELANDLMALMTCRRNAVTEKERRMLRVHDEDIFEWIEEVFIPKFMEIDEDYRAGNQSMWILKAS